MKISGAAAELEAYEQTLLGVRLGSNVLFLHELPMFEALHKTRRKIEAVRLEESVSWNAPEEGLAFSAFITREAQLEANYERIISMASAVMEHEIEVFLTTH